MIVHTITIPYKYGDTFKLLPLSDLHYDGKGRNSICDISKLKRNLAEGVDEKTLIIGVGDWFGGILPSDVRRYRKAHDAADGEDILDEQVAGLAEVFKPYSKSIIGLGDGNHCDTILKNCGTDLIKRLGNELNRERNSEDPIPLLGFSWLLQLRFTENGSRVRSMIIRGHHGWGGGSRTEGADITKFSHDVKFWQADLFLYGHVHRMKMNDIEEGRMVGDFGWKTYLKRMVICGTYQKTFSTSRSATYAEKEGYPSVTLRHPIIYLKPDRVSGVGIRIEF